MEPDAEEALLEDHIRVIEKEKALLTSTLPSLARASSDDDLLSTDLDGEGGSLDDLSNARECHSLATTSTLENMSKDSVESNILEGRHDDRSDQTVSYNLREQNIDYYPATSSRVPAAHQKSLDRDACVKSVPVATKPSNTGNNFHLLCNLRILT